MPSMVRVLNKILLNKVKSSSPCLLYQPRSHQGCPYLAVSQTHTCSSLLESVQNFYPRLHLEWLCLSSLFTHLFFSALSKDFALMDEKKNYSLWKESTTILLTPQTLKGTYFSRVPVLVELSCEVTTLTIHRLLTF